MFRKVIGQKPADAPESPAPAAAPEQPAPAAAPPSSPAPSSPPVQSPVQQQQSPSASRNVLSSDVDIKGSVKFTNDLVVDGKIEGEINSDGNLTVGENARLKAEIKTATIVVYGKVHGNMTASDRVELKASAEVVGDIKAKTLSIEAGAIFVGKSTVGTPSTPAAASSAKPVQQPHKGQNKGNHKGNQKSGGQQGNLAGIKS